MYTNSIPNFHLQNASTFVPIDGFKRRMTEAIASDGEVQKQLDDDDEFARGIVALTYISVILFG
jgi:hypothetical protein